ncbi:MAG: DUF1638 domain-containing protein [Gammaproteobacteria bacterium]|nr:DUF1638 domain-containing protein [Gammaproteobacteria bacterium]
MAHKKTPKKGSGKTLLLACGALAREILALNKLNGWDCFTVECLPAQLHWYPEKIPDAVRQKIREVKSDYDRIFVLFADCGTGGLLDKVLEEEGAERIPGPHCYSFFSGNARFEQASFNEDMTSFYLTDFSVRQFEKFVWEGLGLDRHPELLATYFGNYTKVIYLAQTEDCDLQEKARSAAERLGLEYECRFTGYGDLASYMETAATARFGC